MKTFLFGLLLFGLVYTAVRLMEAWLRPQAAWTAGGNVVCQGCPDFKDHPHAQEWTAHKVVEVFGVAVKVAAPGEERGPR